MEPVPHLTASEWRQIEPVLPAGKAARHRHDDRAVVDALLYCQAARCSLEAVPDQYGSAVARYAPAAAAGNPTAPGRSSWTAAGPRSRACAATGTSRTGFHCFGLASGLLVTNCFSRGIARILLRVIKAAVSRTTAPAQGMPSNP